MSSLKSFYGLANRPRHGSAIRQFIEVILENEHFSIKDNKGYYDLQKYILNFKHHLIKEIFIFDFFINKKNNNEIKLGVRIIFQSKTATITEKQVNNIMQIIKEHTISINGVSIPGLNRC